MVILLDFFANFLHHSYGCHDLSSCVGFVFGVCLAPIKNRSLCTLCTHGVQSADKLQRGGTQRLNTIIRIPTWFDKSSCQGTGACATNLCSSYQTLLRDTADKSETREVYSVRHINYKLKTMFSPHRLCSDLP